MSRRARLTVLELGASPTAWASCHGQGADDWIVIAQQSDEPAGEFAERVQLRARRLCKEDARIEAIDVYAASSSDASSSLVRRGAIEAELSAILAQFSPVLAERQIAMNHQACDPDERSGVRHAIPRGPATGFFAPSDFDEIG
jgi:hypothetical protein